MRPRTTPRRRHAPRHRVTRRRRRAVPIGLTVAGAVLSLALTAGPAHIDGLPRAVAFAPDPGGKTPDLPPTTPPPTTPPGLAPPPAVDANCGTDVSAQLRAFIASVPDGATIAFPAGGCYRVEDTLLLSGRHDLTVEGNGARFQSLTDGSGFVAWDGKDEIWPRQRAHWAVVGASTGITIRNVTVQGPNATASYVSELEGQAGFLVAGATDVVIEGCRVMNVHGDFVDVGSQAARVTVRSCAFSGSGRQGLSVSEGEDVLFDANTVTRVPRSAVDIEPELDWAVRRVTFRGNVFTAPIGHNIFANGGTGSVTEDIVWDANRAVGKEFRIKSGGGEGSIHRRYTFVGNSTDTPSAGAYPHWSFAGLDGIVVRNNVLPTSAAVTAKNGEVVAGGVWLQLQGVTNPVVEGNTTGGGVVEVS